QHDQIVIAGADRAQRESLDDRNSFAEQYLVRTRRLGAELLGREVVDPDELYAGVGEELRRVGRDVSEVAMKLGLREPTMKRASRSKENARRASPLVATELRGIDCLDAVGDVDNARRPDEMIDRDTIDGGAAANEVHGRI